MQTEGRRIHDIFLDAGYPNLAEMAMWIEFEVGRGLLCVSLSLVLPEHSSIPEDFPLNLRSLQIGRALWKKEEHQWLISIVTPETRAELEAREDDDGQSPLVWMGFLADGFHILEKEIRGRLEGVAGEWVRCSLWIEIHDAHETCPECEELKSFDPGI